MASFLEVLNIVNIKLSTTQFVIGSNVPNKWLEQHQCYDYSQQLLIYNALSIYYLIYSVEM